MFKIVDTTVEDEFIEGKLTKKGNIKLTIIGREQSIHGDKITFKLKFTNEYTTRFVRLLEHIAFGKVSEDIMNRNTFNFINSYNGSQVKFKTHVSMTGDTIMVSVVEEYDSVNKIVTLSITREDAKEAVNSIDAKADEILKRRYRQ
ncbi:hypothetical protein BUBS_40 [Bacillus phage Bubs]|uniref:hypothetical protein n=1 Tax=Bacillus phage Nemo TaxID=1805950 RepID=UPI0007A774C7|nr:hypothetical protein BI006_gp040 [Bacillus phage Nemo]AMW63666.1 hypothetical protein NEMO_40 [Bacillus phage Nemo]ASR78652.1 hypothetical protein BUBS_40 [Bacillus phage Bubs]ULF49246.1 hypothetical protein [Bacillus phage MrBubbles]